MFNFNGLPRELRLEILGFFFKNTSDTKIQPPTSNHASGTFRQEYTISVRLPFLEKPTTSPYSKHSTLQVRLSLPHTYQALFTSKSFLSAALPVFIKTTTPELHALTFEAFPSKPLRHNLTLQTLTIRTLLTIMSKTHQIKLSTDQLLPITYHIPFREFIPSLRTVTLHDRDILMWSRFREPVTTYHLALPTLVPGTHTDRDAFQPPGIVEICAPNTRRLLTEREVRDVERELVFPGDLSVLCRYITVRSGSGPLPPIEVRRVVTVACREEVRVAGLQEVRRREVFIDLTIDVGRVRLVKARMRSGELVDG